MITLLEQWNGNGVIQSRINVASCLMDTSAISAPHVSQPTLLALPASYDRASGKIVTNLKDGSTFMFPHAWRSNSFLWLLHPFEGVSEAQS